MAASGSRRITHDVYNIYSLLVCNVYNNNNKCTRVLIKNGFTQYTTTVPVHNNNIMCACVHFLIKTNSVDYVPGALMNSIPNMIGIITYEHFFFFLLNLLFPSPLQWYFEYYNIIIIIIIILYTARARAYLLFIIIIWIPRRVTQCGGRTPCPNILLLYV